HSHHTQASPPVVERLLSRRHAFQEIAGFELEGLGLVHPWCPHVSASVAHQKVVDSWPCSHLEDLRLDQTLEPLTRLVVSIGTLHPPAVHLDPFGRLASAPHKPVPLPATQHAA